MEGNHFEGMVMEGGDKCDNGVERSTFVSLEEPIFLLQNIFFLFLFFSILLLPYLII